MADKTPEDSKQELLDIIAAHPNGVATPDIAERLPDTLPRRTLQYRLKQLVANGRLRAEGTGRWTRYYPVSENRPQRASIRPEDKEYSQLITLSDGGFMVRDYVRQPLAARKPIGYNRGFLEQYRPNSTFYPAQEDRESLRKLGELQTIDQRRYLCQTYSGSSAD